MTVAIADAIDVDPPGRVTNRPRPKGLRAIASATILFAVACGAYLGSLHGPFVLDDRPHIVDNPHIQTLWPPWESMIHTTRPLVGLTLALNHAVSVDRVWSYHAFNILLHAATSVALLVLLLTTLQRTRGGSFDSHQAIALPTALLWAVHPLTTPAVTYVIQRAEVMAAFFTLVTLIALARVSTSGRPGRWTWIAWLACALGMASKPTMAVTPVLALAYDRLILAGSWSELVRRRGRLHLGLFAVLLLLPCFLSWAPREWRESAGFGIASRSFHRYLACQPVAIARYLRLAVWPGDLCFDYGWPDPIAWTALAFDLVLLASILGTSLAFLARRPSVAFLGIGFLLLLAPTSLIPTADPIAEQRMYLPLASVVVAFVLVVEFAVRSVLRKAEAWSRSLPWAATLVVAALVFVLARGTAQRNRDFSSEMAIWSNTVEQRPRNARALNNLALAQLSAGRRDEAVRNLTEAVRWDPDFAAAHLNLGRLAYREGRYQQAIRPLEEAVRLDPDNLHARTNLGLDYLLAGRPRDAERVLTSVVARQPMASEATLGLGVALATQGRDAEAIVRFREAQERHPGDPLVHVRLGVSLLRLGRREDARREFQTALRLDPDNEPVRDMLRDLDTRR